MTPTEPYHFIGKMVVYGFQSVGISFFYVIAVGLLSFHLVHGADSMFQTFGWRNHKWAGGLRKVVVVGCLVYFLANLAIPASVLLGRVGLHSPAVALAGEMADGLKD